MNIHNEFSANSQGYDRVAENLNYVSIEDLADLEDPRLFINKELSCLKLNELILEGARDLSILSWNVSTTSQSVEAN
jgi:hypothetical protein